MKAVAWWWFGRGEGRGRGGFQTGVSGLVCRAEPDVISNLPARLGSARPLQIDLSGEKDFSDVWLPRILRNPHQPVSSKPRWCCCWWRGGSLLEQGPANKKRLGCKRVWKNRTSRDYVDELQKNKERNKKKENTQGLPSADVLVQRARLSRGANKCKFVSHEILSDWLLLDQNKQG